MQGLIAAGADGDWTFGGSILTFAFPMILFIAVASALYILYTKPHLVPGHRYQLAARPAVETPAATPAGGTSTASGPAAGGGQAAAGPDQAQAGQES